MARDRIFGTDTEFMAWLRTCKELPSFSDDCGWVQTDCDTIIHRYKHVVDREGTRDVQGLMHLEIKTRGGRPPDSQCDTLFKLHQFAGDITVNSQSVRHFGVSFVSVDGTTPDNSSLIEWGSFHRAKTHCDIEWIAIDRDLLLKILRFDVYPWRPFTPRPFRRHHKTQIIYAKETTPLGFDSYRQITKRS